MEQKWTKLATISKTHERATAENLGLSKNLLRSLVKSKRLPVVWAGSTALINWDVLTAFLNGELQPAAATTPESGQIKPIPEKIKAVR